jgi:hypothetical protein
VSDPLERPSWACVLHAPPKTQAWWPADGGYRTCQSCDDRLREGLEDVAARFLQLDPRPGAAGFTGSRGAPGFGSRPPLNLHVVALRDPRSSQDAHVWVGGDGRVHGESERPPMSVYGTLNTLGWMIADQLRVSGPDDHDDEYALVRYLSRWLSHSAKHEDLIVEIDTQVRALQGQLRPVTGDGRKYIGDCPVVVPDPDLDPEDADGADPVSCDARLYAPLSLDEDLVCHACGARWGYDEWVELGRLLMAAQQAEADQALLTGVA